jgi:FkbH-like protein
MATDDVPRPSRRLFELLEAFLSAPDSDPKAALRALTGALKQALADGASGEAARALAAAALPTLDYTSAQSLVRILKQVEERGAAPGDAARIAVLGSFTTGQLTDLTRLFLFAAGVRAEIYEADYGVFRQEILDPTSRLNAFRPQFALLCATRHDLAHVPELDADAQGVAQLVEAERADWADLWERLHRQTGCQVVQGNFVPPAWRLLANHEPRHPASLGSFIAQLNATLVERAPPFVTIHDVDQLAAQLGRRAWSDERFFHQAKLPCSPEFLVEYAHDLASIVAAQLGLAKKCLVLDLDNTLWGGVVGDDGMAGLRLGQGDAESEAFLDVQRYARGLRRRGVILAVCSANEDKHARQVFLEHPDMILKLDDIACFVANWNDKATNLRAIAAELNIGLSSMVFLDDDPTQRSLVRQLLPEVSVPEVPRDPAEFIGILERRRYFQVVSMGAEDLGRTELYRGNAERKSSMSSAESLEDFLATLEMVATIEPIGEANLQRSAQLINKTNQFNLTTRRYPPASVLSMAQDPQWITRTVRLTDRFGDNGLISVLLAKQADGVLHVDTWLMSCRVLRRGVESFLMNHLFEAARQCGAERIRGEYAPSPKNELVREHYRKLGFTLSRSEADGRCVWELPVTDDWQPIKTFVREMQSDE